MTEKHTFAPVFDSTSRVLILGSFPSVKSRETGFYYGHPRNRFWKIISDIFNSELPQTIEDKKQLILQNRLALWDVIESCDITGSSDSSIKNVKPNNLGIILDNCNISHIITNGTTAYSLYNKYQKDITGINAVRLPSTSPANAAWSYDKLKSEWNIIKQYTVPTS